MTMESAGIALRPGCRSGIRLVGRAQIPLGKHRNPFRYTPVNKELIVDASGPVAHITLRESSGTQKLVIGTTK